MFTARKIPFIDQFPFALVGVKDSKVSTGANQNVPVMDNGDCMTVTGVHVLSPPEIIATKPSVDDSDTNTVNVDKRCSGCTTGFETVDALMSHCKSTGHDPAIMDKDAVPSNYELFTSFCNVALQRAMGERMARWGKEYIDPKNCSEPKDKQGRSLGVRIFRAYSCEFGITRHLGKSCLSLTVDLRAKVIRTRSLLDNLCQDKDPNKYNFDRNTIQDAQRKFIGEVVICTYDKRCYSVMDLDFDHSPASLPVDGQGMSHAEYFTDKKKIPLTFPNAKPMVAVLGRNNSKIYLPAELVCVNELDAMVKQRLPMIASFRPKDRHDAIEEIKRYLTPGAQKTRGPGGGLLPALGIVLQDERIKVDVEVLPLPLMKAAGMTIPPEKGSMWAPLISRADYGVRHGQLEMNVVVVYHRSLGRNFQSVYGRVRDLVNKFNSSYRFKQEPFAAVEAGDERDHWGAVERHFSGEQPQNVFVLDLAKPPRRQALDAAYSIVKHILTQNGYLSQFINFNTYDHGNPRDARKSNTILQGVARQILSKCGVRVWWVNLPREIPMPAVFVGVDVFHAPRKYDARAGKRMGKESVAAIVVQIIRSHEEAENKNAEVYSETFRRDAGQEMELGRCMNQTVSNALKALDVNPMSCIVWRDGVGSPAINTVAGQEIPAIRQALAAASSTVGQAPGSIPKEIPLSYIVVQKRIATKFLTMDGEHPLPCGSLVVGLQNTEHGTFYINGTSPPYSTPKPARFVIAQMDDGFGNGDTNRVMADLSWALCHDYSNWTGPIKLPSPVQMAHKLAELAGGMPDCGEKIDARGFAGKIHFL